jgi:hypothetical protein
LKFFGRSDGGFLDLVFEHFDEHLAVVGLEEHGQDAFWQRGEGGIVWRKYRERPGSLEDFCQIGGFQSGDESSEIFRTRKNRRDPEIGFRELFLVALEWLCLNEFRVEIERLGGFRCRDIFFRSSVGAGGSVILGREGSQRNERCDGCKRE